MANVIIMILLGILAFFIIITNLFVLYLVFIRRSLRTPSNICLASLAMSDLMAGSIAVPLIISCNVTMDYDGVCHAMDIASRFISISTVLHLLIVTIERYIMICHGIKYNLWVNTRRVVIVLVFAWDFSAVAALIQLTWQLTQSYERAHELDLIYDIVCLGGIVVIPLILIAGIYVRIFVALRYQLKMIQRYNNPVEKSNELRKRHVERKAAIIFGCMILTFTFCWFSYFIDGIREGMDMFTYPAIVQIVQLFLRYVSPLINPLLYTFLKEDFKMAVKMVLCRRFRDGNTTSYMYQTHFAPTNSESPV